MRRAKNLESTPNSFGAFFGIDTESGRRIHEAGESNNPGPAGSFGRTTRPAEPRQFAAGFTQVLQTPFYRTAGIIVETCAILDGIRVA